MGQTWKSTGSTPTTLDSHTYTYDRNGNRLTKTDGVNSAFNETYTYDGLNQISTYAQGSSHTHSWSYDSLGNWSSNTIDGGTAQTRGHNAQNEITSVSGATTPTYDANGNMTKDETGKQYVYDGWNRMVAVKNSSTTATYSYDGLTRRVTETVGSTTTHLYYSAGWQVLEERLNSSTTASIQYVWSPVYIDAMILRDRDTDANGSLDERLWPVQDANFNVTALINNSGAVVEKFTYDAFGLAVVRDASYGVKSGGSDYAWVYRHQGGRWSNVSGLVSFRYREYSPTLGRRMTIDPMKFSITNSINFFSFINNAPVTFTDPMGLGYILQIFPNNNNSNLKLKVTEGAHMISGDPRPGGEKPWLAKMVVAYEPEKVSAGGFIIQHVIVEYAISTDPCSDTLTSKIDSEYWEAWEVGKDGTIYSGYWYGILLKQNLSKGDKFQWPIPAEKSKGYLRMVGYARYKDGYNVHWQIGGGDQHIPGAIFMPATKEMPAYWHDTGALFHGFKAEWDDFSGVKPSVKEL